MFHHKTYVGRYVQLPKKETKHKTSVNFLKISFCRRVIHFLSLPSKRKVALNVNHSVLIVASIKSLINVLQNVKNFSLVGGTEEKEEDVGMRERNR